MERGRSRRLGFALPVGIALVFALALTTFPAAASTALDLVRMAHAHEEAREDDLALRRYMEALSLDPICEEAYLGLGSLRARRGDLREAERVYSVALERIPQLRPARTARAYVRHALGANPEAIADLFGAARDGEEDVAALRVVATWYGEGGQVPAQLSMWRRILARAEATQDATLLHEARTTVRALVILVGPADPAAAPPGGPAELGFRRTLSVVARRAGP